MRLADNRGSLPSTPSLTRLVRIDRLLALLALRVFEMPACVESDLLSHSKSLS
jgi:hypothetical protein